MRKKERKSKREREKRTIIVQILKGVNNVRKKFKNAHGSWPEDIIVLGNSVRRAYGPSCDIIQMILLLR